MDQSAEKFFMGGCLNNEASFWDSYSKIRPEMFSIARLGRIWEAMVKCADAKKPIRQSFIQLFITGDLEETTPLPMFIAALRMDAPPNSEVEIYRETIIHFANKRALLESLDRAKAAVIGQDISVSSEMMKDLVIRETAMSFDGDSDQYLRSYGEWGTNVLKDVESSRGNEELGGVGLSPGLSAVEKCIGRLLPGKLITLAGMSSSGKSALARQIIEAAAIDAANKNPNSGNAYIASLEMTGDEYATRHLSEILDIPSFKIESGDLNGAEEMMIREAVRNMQRIKIKVDSRPRMTIRDISDRCRRLKNSGGLTVVGIDHLILIAGSGKNQSLMDRVSEATIEAKNLAKELQVPVIMLAQLNEKRILESKSGMPNSTHLFGGETIMQNSDVVCFVHRPAVVLAKKEPESDNQEAHNAWKEKLDAIAGKSYFYNGKRRGGAGNIRHEMIFHPQTMKFTDP